MIKKLVSVGSVLSKKMSIVGINTTCIAILHQPKAPKELMKYKKNGV